jgi:hypothetical protein
MVPLRNEVRGKESSGSSRLSMSSMKEGRRHHRIPYTGPIRLSWVDASGNPAFTMAKCIEVSESGIRVEVPVNIPARTILQLNAEKIHLAGACTVRHAVRQGAKHFLGLELSQSMTEKAIAALREPWALRKESPVS